MRHLYYIYILLMLLAGYMPAAAKDDWVDPYKDYDETIFMDMDIEQNILTPAVAAKDNPAVSRYMSRMGKDLAAKGYTVDMTRDDEVVIVTIPTDDLFAPNDTLLLPGATTKLTPIVRLLTDPEWLKLVYAVHTDNTGSEYYNLQLSHERNNSIYDWILPLVSEDLIIIPYEMGDSDPVESNDSRKGRAANRRVEFYLIPGPKLITNAHKGALK